jgi:hypothetical protein
VVGFWHRSFWQDPALANIFPGDESVYFSNDPSQANQAFVKLLDGGHCVLHKRLTWKQFGTCILSVLAPGKIHNNSKYLIHVHKKMYKTELALSVF